MSKFLITLTMSAALLVMLSGCEQDGPAERAGERMDEAVESAGEELEESGEELRDAAE